MQLQFFSELFCVSVLLDKITPQRKITDCACAHFRSDGTFGLATMWKHDCYPSFDVDAPVDRCNGQVVTKIQTVRWQTVGLRSFVIYVAFLDNPRDRLSSWETVYATLAYNLCEWWDGATEQMMDSFKTTRHPVFRATNLFSRGVLKSKDGEETSIHFSAAPGTAELLLRTVRSVGPASSKQFRTGARNSPSRISRVSKIWWRSSTSSVRGCVESNQGSTLEHPSSGRLGAATRREIWWSSR